MLISPFYRKGKQIPEEKKSGKRVEKGIGMGGRMSPFDEPLAGKNIGSCNSNFLAGRELTALLIWIEKLWKVIQAYT